MFKPHRKTRERVYHTEETKRRALDSWKANPTRPKAAIAREFGISPATFNMWTHEAEAPASDGLDSLKVGDTLMSTSGPKRVLRILSGQRYILSYSGFCNMPDGGADGWTVEEMRSVGFKLQPDYRWPEDETDEVSESANADDDLLSRAVQELRRIADALERRAC